MAHTVHSGLSGTYTASAGRRFGLTLGIAFLLLAALSRWRGHSTPPMVLAVAGAALLAAGLVLPSTLGPVERLWMAAAAAIARVTNPVFMAVVYFIVLTPIGVIRRATAGSSLVHRSGAKGFWADRSRAPRSSLERQF